MAASDQTYRKQYTLDIVFGVSSALMLLSIVLMFMQDYYRPFKQEQRAFRDVEATISQRLALAALPKQKEFDDAKKELDDILAQRKADKTDDKVAEIDKATRELRPKKERADAEYQTVKQNYDSVLSLIYLETEDAKKKELISRFEKLTSDLRTVKKKSDDFDEQMKVLQDRMSQTQTPFLEAQSKWKKINDKFETQVKLAISKQWTIWDSVRDFPVIDGFASPIKIHQFTINDIPIDYNLAVVRRFDRCMTCHQAIDRPAYSKDMLRSLLTDPTKEQEEELKAAKKRLKERRDEMFKINPKDAALIPDPDQLTLTKLPKSVLTESRIKEFCGHPRQDLFVGSNSKHPAERFGCTSCHQGQGDGTTFNSSFHSPNNSTEQEKWHKEHDFGKDTHTFLWDYPMLPMRFVESSCLKCHHQVTDLYSANGRNEAPKLLKGYNLIRKNGCFGCHDIQGRKEGREVGPDLRLEPTPPLDVLTPEERHKIVSDPDTAPGKYRKVGPSLYRIAEKTNRAWTLKWLRAPRDFRPDTTMPHFYGLANNDPSVLPDKQKPFPDVEMQAITHYLFTVSEGYLDKLKPADDIENQQLLKQDQQILDDLLDKQARGAAVDKTLVEKLLGEKLDPGPVPNSKVKDAITAARKLVLMRKSPKLADVAPGYKGNPQVGRLLFSEKGCLSCHSHHGTETKQGSIANQATHAPAMFSEAQFGPNLSQITAKLGKSAGDTASARIWLRQWIKDPHMHSPRSLMPVTHLTNEQVADVAEWLLSQKADEAVGSGWDKLAVTDPDPEKYKDLARVYLTRLLPDDYMEKFLKDETLDKNVIRDLPADEQVLAGSATDLSKLKYYLGKKAVTRLGCFGCHDIPNLDAAKPIGTGLMDWGKKKSDKLAFEAVLKYVKDDKKYKIVPSLRDKDGKPLPAPEGKMLYEKYFADQVEAHQRDGYLYQKLIEPRSYDFERKLAWDDRSRMPQFLFARSHKKPGESDQAYKDRMGVDEAEAREAVMTFVLGLVAEPVPVKSINQPRGDRLAEVKGRQIIDKYNCAGCHLIRPGVFDFKLTKDVGEGLDKNYHTITDGKSEYFSFPKNYNWTGKNPDAPDRLTAQVVYQPKYLVEDGKVLDLPSLQLIHALRYPSLESGSLRDIPAYGLIDVPKKNIIYPPPPAWTSEDSLKSYLRDQGALGGDYANMLSKYLADKAKGDPTAVARFGEADSAGINSKGLASGPPSLIGQGERTQTAWLTQFLLDPQPIRKMAILRMPRFNMNPDEAQTLVAYFAALSRIENTGTQIEFPIEMIPQHEDFDTPYWQKKNEDYIERLKKTSAPGEKAGGKSLFELRREQMQKYWQGNVDDRVKGAEDVLKSVNDELDKAKKEAEKDKDAKMVFEKFLLPDLQIRMAKAKDNLAAWKNEKAILDNAPQKPSAKNQEEEWVKKYAYIGDSYKLALKVCTQCHQVGQVPALNQQTPGPALANVYKRLRPGWTERWIALPQRFVHYQSIMPINFLADKNIEQDLFAGRPLDQVTAVRDLLMVFPRVESLPVNRYWELSLPEMEAKKKAEDEAKKKLDKK